MNHALRAKRAIDRRGRPTGLALAALLCLASTAIARAESPIWITKLCPRVPITHEALAAAHAESKNSCIQVPTGDPLEVTGFAGITEYGVTLLENGQRVAKQLPYDFSRLSAVSIGMQLLPPDQEQLPSVSKQRILKRVDGNYIIVQVRVHRDRASGQVYLYYKPFAAIGGFNETAALEFAPLMEDSVREVRSLGLFLRPGQTPTADQLRTLVAVSRDTILLTEPDGSGEPKPREHYELMFVRARVEGEAVTLHTFVTNEFRTIVNYLRPYETPTSSDRCDLRNTIYFTEYTAAKQSPSKKVTRDVRILSRSRYALSALDEYAHQQGWSGDALENLTETLDAIIDQRVPALPEPAGAQGLD